MAVQYLEDLVYRLVPFSDTAYNQYQFVIMDQAQLNAFAVPGGIIGINYGLLLYTDDEDQLASVLAHELGHLSQRHFARGVEQSEQQTPLAIATFLASILLIATNNADAGIAGIMAGQAASVQSQLSYSRSWEKEADRVGMQTLAEAGMDPNAMADMFKNMLTASRYRGNPPEFLLTHPLTANRVSEASDRATRLPARNRQLGFTFQILKMDAELRYHTRPEEALAELRSKVKELRSTTEGAAIRYTLAKQAYIQRDLTQALQHLTAIPEKFKKSAPYIDLQARLLADSGTPEKALRLIEESLNYRPESYLLQVAQATITQQLQGPEAALPLIKSLTQKRPATPYPWFMLKETAGKANQLALAHYANAEFLHLRGKPEEAGRQMDLAIKEAAKEKDFQRREAYKVRLRQMSNLSSHRS